MRVQLRSYSVAGAEALRDGLPRFEKGPAIVGVTSTPFKCPPAPSEAGLLLHDYLVERGRRLDAEISVDKGSYGYAAYWNACKRLASGLSADDKASLFSRTAARAYRLELPG